MNTRVLILLFVILQLASCAPKALTYFHPEDAKFNNYKTYRLLNTKIERTNLSKDGREILDIVELSIREKMRERGYEESNLDPDLILRYEIITNQNTDNRVGVNPLGPPVSSRTFMESLIILDLTDAERKKMFWQSSFDLRQQSRDIRQEQATETAISEIFYSYPHEAEKVEPNEELADWKTGRKKLKAKQKAEKKAEKQKEKEFRKGQ